MILLQWLFNIQVKSRTLYLLALSSVHTGLTAAVFFLEQYWYFRLATFCLTFVPDYFYLRTYEAPKARIRLKIFSVITQYE